MSNENQMKFLTRDQLLGKRDDPVREVDCPELGGKVRLGTLSAADSDALGSVTVRVLKGGTRETTVVPQKTKSVVLALRTEDGKPMFTMAEADKVGKSLPRAAIERLYPIVAEMNGLNEEAPEDLEKN